jgi:hypothetical protein
MKKMNKIYLVVLLAAVALVGCSNQDQEFDDFTKQAVYFPLQFPIRTIILGEDRFDNSIDQEKAFNIGVAIGGLYNNKVDRTVEFEIAADLFPNVDQGFDTIYGRDLSNIDRRILVLPSTHYNLAHASNITVPKGSLSGLLRVNLTDAFFNDPKAFSFNYVLPLRIKNVSHGFEILKGKAALSTNTSPRWYVAGDWASGLAPKDYTLFGVKFINIWHGTYFQRGVQKKDNVVDKVFHNRDVTSNQTARLETVGLNKATYNRMGEKITTATADYKSLLTFSDDTNGEGTVTVSSVPGSSYTITGTGKYFKSNTDMGTKNGWIFDPLTGKIKGSMTVTLDYKVQGLAGATEYQFTDTLVFRTNDVKFEEFSIQLRPKK